MLLVLDVSNSSTKIGLYDGVQLAGHWRIDTEPRQTADEYGLLIAGLMRHRGIDPQQISAAIMSNVIPPLIATFEEMVQAYFGQRCVVVSHELPLGLKYGTDNPAETGADRIVNCLAAHRLYGGPSVVVKFGTATTFDAVSADGAFLGGAITAGLTLAAEALTQRAARLYKVEMEAPPKAIATNTVGNLQSGLVYGYVGLVEGLIARFKTELGPLRKVVATGWEAQYIAPLTTAIDEVNPFLTLEGLRMAHETLCARSEKGEARGGGRR
jgi:type III pantothenate kinase